MRYSIVFAALAAVLATPSWAEVQPGTFAGIPGRLLSRDEAALRDGGDVFIDMDASRRSLKVTVYDNDSELRRMRKAPKESYVVDAHNRVVDTTEAAFMPTAESRRIFGGMDRLTSKPAPFPEGNARVTEIRKVDDKFGPYMIMTDAVGSVEVYRNGERIGVAADRGYALHSNTRDFDQSRSWGCVIVRQGDNARIAESLIADAASAGGRARATQIVRVRGK